MSKRIDALLEGGPRVINVGLRHFYSALKGQGIEAVHLEWNPPYIVEEEVREILDKLL